MSIERRYGEDEAAAIFKRAAEAQEAARQQYAPGEGLTLAELQAIGEEAGITPEFIARAAASVDQKRTAPPATTFMGLPVGVARSVDLPGPLTDEAWDLLVVELRETFAARGRLRREGTVREWYNGNLHVLAEPTPEGHRLRMRTTKGDARGSLMGFLFGLVFLTFLAVLYLASDLDPVVALTLTLLSVGGFGVFGAAAYRLPQWAAERARQMEAVGDRAVELASGESLGATSRQREGVEQPSVRPTSESAGPAHLDVPAGEDEDRERARQVRPRFRHRR